jgi:hypothetical protein
VCTVPVSSLFSDLTSGVRAKVHIVKKIAVTLGVIGLELERRSKRGPRLVESPGARKGIAKVAVKHGRRFERDGLLK